MNIQSNGSKWAGEEPDKCLSCLLYCDGSPEELESIIQAIRENQKTERYLSAKKALRIKRVRL